ncbi:hypothetical protein [Oricola nitratireducens]|uniref:hypothetical protein n=1 Tax=Oricola nitratireducens TaxID=2775868 RepID=UPI0018689B5C|nr:hypothetical protein [Oricola nitratireducens]
MTADARKQNRKPETTDLTRSDLAADEMGNNQLQGDDQESVRNERKAIPGARKKADGVIESFEKLDKNARAEKDLGKGNRSSHAD